MYQLLLLASKPTNANNVLFKHYGAMYSISATVQNVNVLFKSAMVQYVNMYIYDVRPSLGMTQSDKTH